MKITTVSGDASNIRVVNPIGSLLLSCNGGSWPPAETDLISIRLSRPNGEDINVCTNFPLNELAEINQVGPGFIEIAGDGDGQDFKFLIHLVNEEGGTLPLTQDFQLIIDFKGAPSNLDIYGIAGYKFVNEILTYERSIVEAGRTSKVVDITHDILGLYVDANNTDRIKANFGNISSEITNAELKHINNCLNDMVLAPHILGEGTGNPDAILGYNYVLDVPFADKAQNVEIITLGTTNTNYFLKRIKEIHSVSNTMKHGSHKRHFPKI